MPMYIDRHDAPGVSPQELADAHVLDVEAQDKHGVRYHTYWFDPDNGSVFCLAQGPSRQAVEAVHLEAHGLLASAVLELDANAPLTALTDAFGTRLQARGAQTVGGLLLQSVGRIPKPGERFLLQGLEFDVLAASATRLERMAIRRGPVRPIPLDRAEEGGR